MTKIANLIYLSEEDKKSHDWQVVFIVASLSFISGLALGAKLNISWLTALWLFSLGVVLAVVMIFYFSFPRQFLYFSLIIGVGLFGGLFWSITQTDYQTELDYYVNKKISFEAKVISEPDERETLTKLIIKPTTYQSKILVTVERYPEYRLGDVILVRGKMSEPQNFFSATGTPFDYKAYLAKDGIYYEMYKPQLVLDKRPTFGGLVLLANLKIKLLERINSILPEPESSLLAGILLGAKKGIGSEITNNFRLAGVSHILVLSGYNITFVALVLLRACAFLPIFFGGLAGFFGIIAFGLLAGGGSVVWRAVLMSLVALYAKLTGRIFDVTAAIIFSAVALVAYKPSTLVSDLGFQLSIMALIGIVYISPVLKEKIFFRVPTKFSLQELVCSTVGAQLAVLPLLWQATGQVSIIGFISNLFILPFVPYSMIFGSIAILFSFFSPLLAWPVSLVAYFLLKVILVLANLFSKIPLAGLSVTSGSGWLMVFLYLLIFWPVINYWIKTGWSNEEKFY